MTDQRCASGDGNGGHPRAHDGALPDGLAEHGQYLRHIMLEPGTDDRYPFNLPVIGNLAPPEGLGIPPGITFLTGDNGTGKSTLLEAIAVAAGFNAEGGTTAFRFATRRSESDLAHAIRMQWAARPRTGFFLRAESFYNVATEIENLRATQFYGGRSLHERSHGESFLDVVNHRFGPNGLYLLDEPEAALSVRGCLALIARIVDLLDHGCQFIVATHSPILLAVPGAHLLEISDDGSIAPIGYDQSEPVRLMRAFLDQPSTFLHHLLAPD